MPLFPWLLSIISPLVKRALIALGIGVVSMAGFQILITQLTNEISTRISGLPQEWLQIITLYGLPESLGIILGAFATASTIVSLKRFQIL